MNVHTSMNVHVRTCIRMGIRVPLYRADVMHSQEDRDECANMYMYTYVYMYTYAWMYMPYRVHAVHTCIRIRMWICIRMRGCASLTVYTPCTAKRRKRTPPARATVFSEMLAANMRPPITASPIS